MIACVFIPYLATDLARRFEPTLNGHPLIISKTGRVAQVIAVSAEAAEHGIKPGMSLRQAQVLCPQVQQRPTNPTLYQDTLKQITTRLAAVTDKVEAGPDYSTAILYADLNQLNRGDQVAFASQISQTIQEEMQLIPALGLASGKFPAYVAAGSIGTNRVLCIAPGQEGSFLAPLDVTHLPLDTELARRLGLLGLRTVGQFAALSKGAVLTQFGATGRWLHQLARGYDDRPVLAYQSQPAEEVTRPLDGPAGNRLTLRGLSQSLAEELNVRLMARGCMVGRLKLILHLDNDGQQVEQRHLREPAVDTATLARHLVALIEQTHIAYGVVALTVQAVDLVLLRSQQLDLFSERSPSEQPHKLRELIPQLIARYGADCFYEPVITNPQATLPERRYEFRGVSDQ